jgi:predicted aspartyl protease
MFKYLINFLWIYFYCIPLKAQLSLSDFKNLEFGTNYLDTIERNKIINLFDQDDKNYTIWEGDFLKTHDIEFHHLPFDYYGNTEYLFQYVKDTLACLKIENCFSDEKIEDFSRLVKQIYSDLNSHFEIVNAKTTNFDVANMVRIAKRECIKNGHAPDQILGRCSWAVDNKRIMVTVEIKSEDYFEYNYISGSYDISYKGPYVKFVLAVFDLNTQHLYFLNEKQKINYVLVGEFMNKKYYKYVNNNYVNQGINDQVNRIKLKDVSGVYELPVTLNGVLTMDFILDLGASDVSISPDVFLVLVKSGTVHDEDFIGSQTYQFADGTTVKSDVINLKSIRIGGKVIENIRASVSKSVNTPLLLGQSAMKKLTNYKIDVEKKVLVIE